MKKKRTEGLVQMDYGVLEDLLGLAEGMSIKDISVDPFRERLEIIVQSSEVSRSPISEVQTFDIVRGGDIIISDYYRSIEDMKHVEIKK